MYFSGARHMRRIITTSHKLNTRHSFILTTSTDTAIPLKILQESNLHRIEAVEAISVIKQVDNLVKKVITECGNAVRRGPIYSGDEIVISGISGRFPQSDNLEEFKENLMNGLDMVCKQNRFKVGNKVPPCYGFMKNLEKFDAQFFGVPPKMAQVMDPALRKLFEVTFEAMVDGGVNPETLRGSKTGVFVGTTGGEGMDYWWLKGGTNNVRGYYFLGNLGLMQANHLSYTFDLQGPSMVINTGCSASLVALESAIDALRAGKCDSAIVASTSTQLNPLHSYEMKFLNALSPIGKCQSFSKEGDGFARGEAVVALLVQREKDAKRNYALIRHVKSNSDGFKKEGVFFPSGISQERLLKQMYEEADVDPGQVSYIEAHGTGTPAGDPQELEALSNVFCTKGRTEPLLVGSVKSNMGHGESAAGLCGIAKILIAAQTGFIPPNLHFTQPSDNVAHLFGPRGLKVVSERTPWKGGTVGVSAFGFGGTNAHAILELPQVQQDIPIESPALCENNLVTHAHNNNAQPYPVILPFSGRSEPQVKESLEKAIKFGEDLNFASLIHNVFQKKITGHGYRGYGICGGVSSDTKNVATVSKFDGNSSQGPPLWFIFPGMGSQWNQMGKDLLKIDVFRDSFVKAKITLKNAGVDLEAILQENNPCIFENIRESVVAITAVQVALYDTILSLTRPPDGYIGHSFGELLCAYADGCMSAEETLLVADARGRAFQEAQKSQKSPGGMASVGLTWSQIQSRCPPRISPACHNSSNNVTVSGPLDEIQKFVKQLQSEGIFAKEIHSCHFAAHSKYVEPAVENYTKYLNEIYNRSSRSLERESTRSSKWVSTAFPQSDWNGPLAQSATPAYHVHNMTSPVLFHEAVQHIPSNAVVVEIAPQGLFQTILRGSLSKQCQLIAPMNQKADNKLNHFLMSIGEIYNAGVDVNFFKLYPAPNFPISGQTPGISSLIRWDHAQDWIVPITNNPAKHMEGILNIDLNDNHQSFLEGHKLDNRCVFPATGYLVFAWETLAASLGLEQNELPVIFEDINFERATFLSYNNPTQLRCSIFPGSGLFEIHQGGMTVVKGKITTPDTLMTLDSSDSDTADFKNFYQNTTPRNISNCLSTDDVYKEIQLKGYSYTGSFRGIQRADIGGNWAEISWDGNWVTFLDCALQSSLVAIKSRNTVLPIRLLSVEINPKEFFEFLDSNLPPVQVGLAPAHGATTVIPIKNSENSNSVISTNNCNSKYCESENIKVPGVPCVIQKEIGALHCPGVEIRGVTAALAPRKKQHGILSVNEYKFRPYYYTDLALEGNTLNSNSSQTSKTATASLAELIGIVCENSVKRKLHIFDIFTRSQNSVSDMVRQIFSSQPMYEAYLNIMSTKEELSKLDKQILGFGTIIEKPSRQDFFTVEVEGKNSHEGLQSADLLFIDDVSALADVVPLIKTDAWIVLHTPVQDNCESGAPILFPNEFLPVARKFSESGDSFLLKLLGKREEKIVKGILINSQNFEWLENLKSELSTALSSVSSDSKNYSRLFVCSQNNPTDGIIGLVKCLRLEPGGDRIRCIFDPEGKLNLDFEKPDSVLSEIIDKDLVMNVFKNGSHGSYRHLPLTLNQSEAFVCPSKAVEHARVTMLTLGDLSSFRWVESPLTVCETVDYVAMQTQCQYLDQNSAGTLTNSGAWREISKNGNSKELYSVHYSSMNFFNVMLASGKLPIHSKKDVSVEDILLGFEFAGLDSRGNRMMGVVASNTLASSVLVGNESLMWRVPDSWTLEEAATVPVVYATAYYALFYRAQMRRGQSILIHSGSGGTGQAAIRVALDMNCEIFTTVGSEEKRSYIKQLFPQLKDSNIGNSRDCRFEKMILRQTSGRGVDIILNSLADDKLQASVRCLASNGKFLEIGKFDASRNHSLGMECFLKNIEFHGIDFEKLLLGEHDKEVVLRHVEQGILAGVVKPLARSVFSKDQVEDAFRYMMSGKHIGKVVIQVREENSNIPENNNYCNKFQAIPRTYCSPTKSYLIVGGLGGFGLELANWLIERGAQHLILTSRSGVRKGYQNLCLQKWAGKNVQVDTPIVDLANIQIAKEFIKDLYNNGRCLGGIFNSGLVVKDGLLQDQTAESFELVGMPKIKITQNLDRISREETISSDLDYFVVFSSVACGLGNPGQSNYGYANAIMENICEARRADGFPALAIQWGIIGDVGYVAERMMVKQKKVGAGLELEPSSILGLIPQKIFSCLEVLDATLEISKDLSLSSSCCFSSMVIADKIMDHSSMFKKLGLSAAVARICGVQDLNKINPATPLVELGVDSLSGIELKQLFERDYSLELSPKQIRGLKFGDLKMIEMGTFNPGNNSTDLDTSKVQSNGPTTDDGDDYMGHILNSFRENPKESLIKLNTDNCDQGALPLFIVHGGDGLSAPFIPMASKVKFDLYCFQLISREGADELSVRNNVEDFATEYIRELKQVQPEGPYNISGYSSGGTIAFEMVTQLELLGDRVENLIIFDGFCSSESVAMEHSMGILVTEALAIVKKVVDITEKEEKEVVEKFSETPGDLEASKRVLMDFLELKLSTKDKDFTSPSHPRGRGIRNYFNRMISFATMSSLYRPGRNFQGKCHLIKAAVLSSGMDGFRDETCHLKQYCDQPVIVNIVRGDHHSFLSALNIEETTTILNHTWNTRRQDLQDECVMETEALRDANKMHLPN